MVEPITAVAAARCSQRSVKPLDSQEGLLCWVAMQAILACHYASELAARQAPLRISLHDTMLTYCLVVNKLHLERGEDRRHAQYCWTVRKKVEIACTVQHIWQSYPNVTHRRRVRETWPCASSP